MGPPRNAEKRGRKPRERPKGANALPLFQSGGKVLPAVRKLKEVEALLTASFPGFVLLGGHVGQINRSWIWRGRTGKTCCCMPI